MSNPEPSGDNYFEYDFTPDASTIESCQVSGEEALSWIAFGQNSFGKIPKGWVDKLTVFFKFPSDIGPCTAIYNFNLRKDNKFYASQKIEFNIN